MSKQPKILKASDAMEKAKKNAVKRRETLSKSFRASVQEKIEQMTEDGLVDVFIPMSNDEYTWALPVVKPELEELGYIVIVHEDEDIPDLQISIEHLK